MGQLEKEVCKKLTYWFEKNNIEVWQNYGNKKFQTKGNNKKPDLIIYSKELETYIAIEVKPGKKSQNILSSSKIIEYQKNYINKETKYYINDKKIDIEFFCVATLYSMFGCIFNELESTEIHKATNQYLLQSKVVPSFEFIRTKDFVRNLWVEWKKTRTENEKGIGVILTDTLFNEETVGFIGKPLLFAQQRNECGNKRWKQVTTIL